MLVYRRVLILAWLLYPMGFASYLSASSPSPDFDREIRPVLSNHCFACHGPDATQRQAELRLDERDSMVAAGVLNEAELSESEILARITSSDPEFMMPPPDFGKPLKGEQIEKLKAWVLEGAQYDIHWSFASQRRPTVPTPQDAVELENPIDAFIIQLLATKNAQLSPVADSAKLCRRLYLDLLGVPPTWEEAQTFTRARAKRGTAAVSELVEQLFRSPRYGERMAAHWLDLVRYADTVGFHGDQNQNVYPYRDYVIDAFQQNKPFDQFTIEQIAGDLIPGATAEQRIASGFNRLNMMTREGGAQPREYLAKYQADRVRTIGITWLGLTTGCAECHDHKYDPVTTRDFYRLSAFFADLKQWGVYSDYGYTPNEELRGFDNDSPFPPELEVQNRGLLQQQRRIYQEMLELAKVHVQRSSDNGASFLQWVRAIRDWLSQNPTGWQLVASSPNKSNPPMESKDAGTAGTPPTSSQETTGWEVRVGPTDLNIAAVRIDLPIHDSAYRSGNLQFQFLLEDEKGATHPVEVRRADATEQKYRYQGGSRILDVRDNWLLPDVSSGRELAAVWQFVNPITLQPGHFLRIRTQNIASGSQGIQVQWTPIPRLRPFDPTLAESFAIDAGDTWNQNDIIMSFFLGFCGDEGVRATMQRLERQYRACRDGWTWTQVSASATPLEIRVLPRGNWLDESGEVVLPGLPQFLVGGASGNAEEKRLNRLDLARWIVSDENPLTSRAVVNRVWGQFFGTGLCSTLDDLGAQGDSPSHPELLDWLAVEFRESGWDLRHIIRLIVTSRTYQQDSRVREDLVAIDPLNRWLGSHPPRRLEAEVVRDNILAISGLLRLDVGGPACRPPQPPGYYANLQFPDRDYHADEDGSQYRRGIYMHWQRTFLHPMLAAFDAPSREDCVALRNRSNTPQQALVLLNDPTFTESARAFAERILGAANSDIDRVRYAFHTALAREPTEFEVRQLREFLNRQRTYYATSPDTAKDVQPVGIRDQGKLVHSRNPSEYATWFALARVVLNLHEVITRY
jgi:Protein of unknown function (DUF1553)/Protein of unknown function (DUF1549)/Planctomycete cytochrome C